jgi:hypothetical protein
MSHPNVHSRPLYIDQTAGPHVGPIRIDVFKAVLTAVLAEDNLPPVRYICKRWPEGVLSLVIDQNEKPAVLIVEWIAHYGLPSTSGAVEFDEATRRGRFVEKRLNYETHDLSIHPFSS